MAASAAYWPITSTSAFTSWNAFFTDALNTLQDELARLNNNEACSALHIFTLSEALLNAAKFMIAFLGIAASLSANDADARLRHWDAAWIRSAIADLRVNCHRYSSLVTQLANSMRTRGIPAELSGASIMGRSFSGSGDRSPDQRSADSITSPNDSVATSVL